jgi:nicotinate-nucleotide adenylyltransferase
LAKWVLENTDLDEVWLMVSPNNPLKDKSILADEQERLAAAKEAIGERREAKGDGREERGKRIRVSDFEFHLSRPTYTANTMRALAREYPEHEFTLIIGEDNLSIFDKWRESDYLLNQFRIFVYPRHGCPAYTIPPAKEMHILHNAPYFDISSTELRKNLHK